MLDAVDDLYDLEAINAGMIRNDGPARPAEDVFAEIEREVYDR